MKKQQSGFTLIELVMVIVILGILAATALPKFAGLQDEANAAKVDAMAGALSSAYSINYAICTANSANTNCTTANTCADLNSKVDGVSFVTSDDTATDDELVVADTAVTNGSTNGTVNTATCNVTLDATSVSSEFVFIAAGN